MKNATSGRGGHPVVPDDAVLPRRADESALVRRGPPVRELLAQVVERATLGRCRVVLRGVRDPTPTDVHADRAELAGDPVDVDVGAGIELAHLELVRSANPVVATAGATLRVRSARGGVDLVGRRRCCDREVHLGFVRAGRTSAGDGEGIRVGASRHRGTDVHGDRGRARSSCCTRRETTGDSRGDRSGVSRSEVDRGSTGECRDRDREGTRAALRDRDRGRSRDREIP